VFVPGTAGAAEVVVVVVAVAVLVCRDVV